MKKLLIVVVLAAVGYAVYPTLLAVLGLGAGAYGADSKDPLGTVVRLQAMLAREGLVGDQGNAGSPRSVEYRSEHDKKLYPDFINIVKVDIGEDEYVQRVTAAFVSTQRGYSPARPTGVERFMHGYWKALSGQSKLRFERKETGQMKLPYGIKLTQAHMETGFENDLISGVWMHDAEKYPLEFARIELK